MVKNPNGGVLSYSTASHLLFDKMDYGESLLLLYHKSDCHKQVFRNLIANTEGNGMLVNYISHRKNRLKAEGPYAGYMFKQVDDKALREIKGHLDAHFSKLEEEGAKGLVLADWGQGKVGDCPLFAPFIEEFVQRCRSSSLSNWQKLKGKKGKKRILLVNAFDVSQVETDFISKAISLHERTILLEEGHSTAILPKVSPSWKNVTPKIQLLPQPLLENLLKGNMEFIMLLQLEKGDKSGYQLLKHIAGGFHCILSQGTLYPLLYKLEKQGKIIRRNGKGREVIYSLGPEAEEALQTQKEHMLDTISHFAGLISASGKTQPDNEETEKQMSLPVFAADPNILNIKS